MRAILYVACSTISILAPAVAAPPVALIVDTESRPIGRLLEILKDDSANLSPTQALASDGYQVSSVDVLNLLPSRCAYWLRCNIANETSEQATYLSIPYADIDELDVYLVQDEGVVQLAHSGRSVRKSDRTGNTSAFEFKLPISNGSSGTVLIRIRGFKTMHIPAMLGGEGVFPQARAEKNLLLGVFAGMMFVLGMYNLFIYLSIKDRSYLFYVLYIIAICLAQLSYLGFGPFDLIGDNAFMNARSSLLFSLLAIVLGMEFQRRFINTVIFARTFHKWYPAVYALVIANMFVYLVVDPWLGFNIGNAICGLTALIVLITAVVSVRNGSRQAGFFLLAWSVFLAGVVVFVLKDAGVLSYTSITANAMPVGSAIEGILLSFGLADRINILRKEKEMSQAQALESATENARIIRDQNVLLEHKVTERTHQLQKSLDDLKQAQSQLVEAEKMSSLGQLTAGIAHEINNPINFIRSNIAPLKRDLLEMLELLSAYRAQGASAEVAALEKRIGVEDTVKEIREILRSMEEGANRTAEIVRGLRTFSRLDENDLKPVDLNDGLRNTLSILGPQMRDRIAVALDLGTLEQVECFPGQINQVLLNLLTNARQAVVKRHGDRGGRIEVVTRQLNDHVIVTVRDNGTGMSEEVRARIFEPFFTTKDVGEGTGLGLSIAHSIIERHQGQIHVESSADVGTTFTVTLPNAQAVQIEKRA
jgi:signal transduction histidine kinase